MTQHRDTETGMTVADAYRVLDDPEEDNRENILSAKVTINRAILAEREAREPDQEI